MDENFGRSDVSLPVSQLLEIDRICLQFEAAWNAGEEPKAEDFLGEMEEPARSQLRKELAALDAALRHAAEVDSTKTRTWKAPSTAPSLEEFIRRLIESGLMTGQEVRRFLDSLTPEHRPTAADQLARLMFQKGLLTKFQAQAVFQGRTRGLVMGNYVVLEKLGAGGMGQVYKAQHRKMKRIVALKVLLAPATKSPDAVKRFQREVEAAAKLSHPNIVTAHDADQANGVNFLVMEHVNGQDLAAWVKGRGPLPVAQAVDCMVQAARGLEYAHRQGVIHRDIKPSNLLLDASGVVKILDLGLARVADTAGDTDDSLSRSGQVMGTLDYMAPEQALDTHHADARSDIYGLGCTFHYLLAGSPPFAGDTMAQKILAHREQPIPSLRAVRPDVPEWLDGVFHKMLAKRPEDRQQTMGEVMAQLQQHALPQAEPAVSIRASSGNLAETLSLRQGKAETSSEQVEVASPGCLPSPSGGGAGGEGMAKIAKRKLWSRIFPVFQQLPRRQRIAIATAVGFLFAFVLFGIILTLRTKEGTLEIVTDDPNVQVAVKQNGAVVEVVDVKSGWRISLKSGEYELETQGSTDQFQLDTNSVLVKRGETVRVTATLKRFFEISNSKSEITNLKSPLPAIGSFVGPDGKWKLPPGAPPPAIAPFDDKIARQHQEAWAKHLGVPVELTNSIGMRLVLIPPGEFEMGSPKELIEQELKVHGHLQWISERLASEGPQHRVRITKPFYLGTFLVTQGEYRRVVGANPSQFAVTGTQKAKVAGQDTGRFPVENVSWDDAVAFCRKLSELPAEKSAGRSYRLPTEAQWECACRSGSTGRFTFSSNTKAASNERDELDGADYGWFENGSGMMTHAVGGKRANAWGLYDMHGNVFEWCKDWYDKDYYRTSPVNDPAGPLGGSHRILRGGAWSDWAWGCRSASRVDVPPESHAWTMGLRVLLVLPDTSAELRNTESQIPNLKSQMSLPTVASLVGADGKWKLPPGAPPPAIAPFDDKTAKKHQEAWAKHIGVPVELTNSIGMKLVLIPPGEFMMGSPKELIEEELKAHRDDSLYGKWYLGQLAGEGPQHRVRITKPFYVGACQVTQREYRRVMGVNPSAMSAAGWCKERVAGQDTEQFPVDSASWNDAVEFCRKLSETWEEKAAGHTYRLLSEAQREYACRAGSTGRFSFSSKQGKISEERDEQGLLDYGWFARNSGSITHAVGLKRANPWGLHDMCGNVSEWCQDWYGKDYYAMSPVDDPTGPLGGECRVLRGGGWGSAADSCRSAFRIDYKPGSRAAIVGFRASVDLTERAAQGQK